MNIFSCYIACFNIPTINNEKKIDHHEFIKP